MKKLVAMLKNKSYWVGVSVVLVPLGLLLGLQINWLNKLEKTSAVAYQTVLQNTLETVATEVEYFYRSLSERVLNVPSAILEPKNLSKVSEHWSSKSLDGVQNMYFVDYTQVPTGNFYEYSRKMRTLKPSTASEESLALVIACLPWQARVLASSIDEFGGLYVNEQEPKYRIVLNPISDGLSRTVGIAAMVLDQNFFSKKLLPRMIEKILCSHFSKETCRNLMVVVRNQDGRIVIGKDIQSGLRPAAASRFHFVFTDWTLDLFNLGVTPKQWAKKSFIINITLAILLALVLFAGIMLTLRVAGRTMRLSQMKSDFVSNVSHELRTPLASIRVFAEFLRLGRISSIQKAKEYGEYIEIESRRLSRLIDNILDFSRIESGRKEYRFELTRLDEVVQAVLKSYLVSLEQNGFGLTLDLPDNPLPLIKADSDAVAQALHNLLDNAVKYSPEKKSIVVRVFLDGDFVVLSVRDHGLGISKEEQKRIFERFHRVGSGLVHDIKGNGLGLSIVRHVVESHGGEVKVESELGQGSTFSIRLPLHKPNGGH